MYWHQLNCICVHIVLSGGWTAPEWWLLRELCKKLWKHICSRSIENISVSFAELCNIILGFNFTLSAFSIHFIDLPTYPPKIPLMKMSFLKRVKLCTKSPKEPSHLTCFSQSELSISLSIYSYFVPVRLILPRYSFHFLLVWHNFICLDFVLLISLFASSFRHAEWSERLHQPQWRGRK